MPELHSRLKFVMMLAQADEAGVFDRLIAFWNDTMCLGQYLTVFVPRGGGTVMDAGPSKAVPVCPVRVFNIASNGHHDMTSLLKRGLRVSGGELASREAHVYQCQARVKRGCLIAKGNLPLWYVGTSGAC